MANPFLRKIPEMTINRTLPYSLCILISAAASAADDTAEVIMDGGPCLDIVSPIERLACFEEQANAAQGRGTSIRQQNLPVVSIPRNSSQQPASEAPQEVESAGIPPADSIESDFGLPEETINDQREKAQENELIARVAKIKELDRNRFLITLENGQTWEQMETKRFALAEGDEVRIYSTRWGSSYRLSSQSRNGFIQVQRLR